MWIDKALVFYYISNNNNNKGVNMWPFKKKTKQEIQNEVKQVLDQCGPIMKDGKLVGFKTGFPFPNSILRIERYGTTILPDPNTCYVFNESGEAMANGSEKEIITYLNTQFNNQNKGNQQ